jgi:hypothetical protein
MCPSQRLHRLETIGAAAMCRWCYNIGYRTGVTQANHRPAGARSAVQAIKKGAAATSA